MDTARLPVDHTPIEKLTYTATPFVQTHFNQPQLLDQQNNIPNRKSIKYAWPHLSFFPCPQNCLSFHFTPRSAFIGLIWYMILQYEPRSTTSTLGACLTGWTCLNSHSQSPNVCFTRLGGQGSGDPDPFYASQHAIHAHAEYLFNIQTSQIFAPLSSAVNHKP